MGATYVGDIIENVNQKDYVGVLVPHSSWKTYVENGVQGAFVGGFCGAFFESGVGCVGGATFGTSLAKQELNNGPIAPWQLDYCQAAVESGFAAGGTATGKAFFPYKVRGRYPLWHNAAFWLGKHAQRSYAESALDFPLAVAGEALSCLCHTYTDEVDHPKE